MTQATPLIDSKRVNIPLASGLDMQAYLAEPRGASRAAGVLVLHEIFGLTEDIQRIADRFASHGYIALAPDLYAESGSKALCVVRTLRSLTSGQGPVFSRLAAAQAHLEGLSACDESKIAVAGFCMGGGFAILHALRTPEVRVAAPFYAAVPKQRALPKLCPTVASYGERDTLFLPHAKRLKRGLEANDIPHDLKIYPGVGHSFMNQHQPGLMRDLGELSPMKVGFNQEASEDAWRRMLEFFTLHLDAPASL